jgi:uridine kinase
MARWAPERRDTIHALADEVRQNYSHGRVVVAVDGADAAITARFADDLAADLSGQGHAAERASVSSDADVDAVRSGIVAPFRASLDGAGEEAGDGFLVVDGHTLLGPELRGLWNFSVRLDGSEPSTDRADASAILNVADPDQPRRVFADSC